MLGTIAGVGGLRLDSPLMQKQETNFTSIDFRRALGRFATGITVVTMQLPEGSGELAGEPTGAQRAFGITVNAFMSISLEPPLIAISIDKRAGAHATLEAAKRFGVSVLSERQEALSDLFAGRPVSVREEPFEEFALFPVIKGALTQMVCRPHKAVEAGDHTIFIGEVQALRSRAGEPLLFYGGAYHRLPEPAVAR